MKKFDLNIEKILENWEVKHAVREIIANALDEQFLTHTDDIKIFKQGSEWIIKDFGRGLKYEHFTQNENDEKLTTPGIIGKFGIGLKDAMATFERKGVLVRILSKYGDITLGRSQKSGFDDLVTLHAYITEPSNPYMVGTEFHLSNISDNDIEDGKRLFLKFNAETILEKVQDGCVLNKSDSQGKIYINGVLVATEENFLFSYNITSISSILKKALNRERTNVGRTAYAGIIKKILLSCNSEEVGKRLSDDLSQFGNGNNHDEMKWVDVQAHAAEIMNKYKRVVFVTHEDIQKDIDIVREARNGGAEVVVIPKNLGGRIIEENEHRDEENKVRTFDVFVEERNRNFDFKFVEFNNLTEQEKEIFNLKEKIFQIIGGKPDNVHEIKISETMQKDKDTFLPAAGLWRSGYHQIVILRTELKSKADFLGVLLHEMAHAISGATDATREFESELTRLLGLIASRVL